MNLFQELQRRNVFRVTIGYLISAWLLAQVADLVLENIGAPDWVIQTILLVLALGLPVVVFFSWAYEVTPEGIKREAEVDRSDSITHVTGRKLDKAIIAMLVVALGYFIWEARFADGPEPDVNEVVQVPATAQEQSAPGVEIPPPESDTSQPDRLSIAVLPFENRSNLDEDQYFTDGIHDDLLTTIAKIGSMKVISRTSVMEYRGTTKKIPEIAEELGVAHVLEGGIQRAGNQVRINVQLIDAKTDEHLWAEIFDRELTVENLFAIQSEISTQIAQALEAALTPEEQRRIDAMPTNNLAAYEAYLLGKQLMATRRVADLRGAIEQFQKAVDLDPGFALAWVGLADSHDLFTGYRREPASTSLDVRQDAVDKALALDPELGEAWISQAQIYMDLDQPIEAESAYRKGLELSPNYAQGYLWYGSSFSEDDLRAREQLELAYRARELEPRSSIAGENLAYALFGVGLYDRAVDELERIIALDPDFPGAYHQLQDHYQYNTGEFSRSLEYAIRFTELDPENPDGWRHQAEAFVNVGDYETARSIQQKIAELNPDHYFAGWIDFLIATRTGNEAAFRETVNWILPRSQDLKWLIGLLADGHVMIGDLESARELYLRAEPGWADPVEWDRLVGIWVSDSCIMSWLFLNSGDETLGAGLLELALEVHEVRLPAVTEHPTGPTRKSVISPTVTPKKPWTACRPSLITGISWVGSPGCAVPFMTPFGRSLASWKCRNSTNAKLQFSGKRLRRWSRPAALRVSAKYLGSDLKGGRNQWPNAGNNFCSDPYYFASYSKTRKTWPAGP